ncbi:hypothetical protein ONS95_003537 [Cadophora gregata]|uniref:uncharacterized protein n=1 Tax=Cadophora gregata TaxID=51156 RepID=UPI0026DC4E01|nr:uncharacterized protein ONS95_003537 [Cadophora gregata]KAK0106815.1 hypothetical protein ONS95_003537 [Cadophora gregata]
MASTQTLTRSSSELVPLPHSQDITFSPKSNILSSNTGNAFDAEVLMQNLDGGQEVKELSRRRATVVVTTVAGVNFLNTMGSGILTVALPTIAKDLSLGVELLLWPASIYALTCGCTLLLAGSLADILGRRITFLVGTSLYSAFTLGCGLSPTGTSLIIFRGFQGLSISLYLTTAVGIISTSFPATGQGNRRNFAFAATGAASPVGYTVGLVLGGLFVQSVGWRWCVYSDILLSFLLVVESFRYIEGETRTTDSSSKSKLHVYTEARQSRLELLMHTRSFHFAAILNVILCITAVSWLPADETPETHEGQPRSKVQRMKGEIDWVGAGIATASISTLSYVLAIITGKSSSIKSAQNISLLTIALLLIPAFIFWMSRQECLGRPAIIPNSIWKQSAFTTTCIVVFLTWGAFNPFGYFTTLFFQEIQHLGPLATSLRFLPTVVCGILTNIVTGLLVRKTAALYLVAVSSAFSALACILMAIVHPEWSFWVCAFPAVFLSPMSSDVLYTISNLIITSSFPASKQSLAGGVFNTVSQIGNSVGLTMGAVIAASVTSSKAGHSSGSATKDEKSVLNGYRATFYMCFAAMACVVVVGAWGLRGAGKVGVKKE